MPLLCCDVGLVSELRLTADCVLMDLVSPAVSQTSVYANGLIHHTTVLQTSCILENFYIMWNFTIHTLFLCFTQVIKGGRFMWKFLHPIDVV